MELSEEEFSYVFPSIMIPLVHINYSRLSTAPMQLFINRVGGFYNFL